MKSATPLSLISLLLGATAATAQPRVPDPAPPTPAETQQVAPTPQSPAAQTTQPDLVEDIDGALARARSAYRSGPLCERIQVIVTTANGEVRQSNLLLRLDPGATGPHPRKRRFFLDLGRLQVQADDNSIIAATPREASLYFRSPVIAPLTLDQLWNAVPPIPLPQLEWAFGEGSQDLGRVVAGILQTSWVAVQHTQDLGVIFTGTAPGGPASAEFTHEGRLVSLTLPLTKSGDSIQLKVRQEHPSAGPPPMDTANRKSVPSLADLRPRPPELFPGARLPALSLMTTSLDSWSLQDELDRAPSKELAAAPVFGLIIAYRPAGPTAQPDAELATRAISLVKRDLTHSHPDPASRPRLVPLIVGFLDLPDMSRAKLVALDTYWSTLPGETPPRYFSPSGAAEMERLTQTTNAAMLLVDSTQKILATIQLETRPDAETIAQEIEAAIESTLKLP